jgi:multiple sugar transport system ATP-binding protein
MARVTLERVSKIFSANKGEAIRAVTDISLSVEDKELLTVVGPSGCGKSTTLRLIAGFEEPSSGTISIDGHVVNDVPPKDRDIAMVFQNHALYPHMTAYENMAFGLKLRKVSRPEIERRVKDAAELLGLLSCLDRYPKTLSGGERQRVALGRALVRQPKVFLLDEPLSNLDVPLRTQMRAEIARLHTRLEATMIYVTHDQVEAMTLGDRIAVMKQGAIQQLAEPTRLYDQPANLFVAAFIGSPPMNFFSGTILRKNNAFYLLEQTGAGSTEALLLRLDEQKTKALRAGLDKNVVLGLRPEHVRVQAIAGPNENTFTATVELVEPMGAETYVSFTIGTHRLVARLPATFPAKVNQKVLLTLDMSKAHFFDPASELALN